MTELATVSELHTAIQTVETLDNAKDLLDQVDTMKGYARRVGNYDAEKELAIEKILLIKKIGHFCSEIESLTPEISGGMKNGGLTAEVRPHSKKDTLKQIGIPTNTAARYEKIDRFDDEKFFAEIEKAREKDKPITVGDLERVINKDIRKDAQVEKEADADISEIDFTVTADQTVIQCQALVTDPPYGILDEEWDDIHLESFTREWLSRWNECGADLFISAWSSRHLFDGRQWFDDELTNYDFQQVLIWHYANNKKPNSKLFFKHTYEPIYIYRRKESVMEIGVGGGEWGKGLNDFDCHVSAMPQSNFNDANMKQHPAQKSLDVMRWLVNAVSSPGDLIVDPFCGSGTTGIAAKQLHRNFHGIEINDEYAQLAVRRIATYGSDDE